MRAIRKKQEYTPLTEEEKIKDKFSRCISKIERAESIDESEMWENQLKNLKRKYKR